MRRLIVITGLLITGFLYAAQPFAVVNTRLTAVRRTPSTTAERVTEALYGEPALILKKQAGWIRVSLPLQRHQRQDGSWGGYRGWVPAEQLIIPSGRTITDYLSKLVSLHTDPSKKTIQLYRIKNGKPVPYRVCQEGTILPDLGEVAGMQAVLLPDGSRGLVHKNRARAIVDQHTPLAFSERFIAHARKHLKTPYLWGGTGGAGLDCSGLVYLAAKTAGKLLPRDSGPQYAACTLLKKKDARRGDLVFFTTTRPGPSHVAIFLGRDRIIHAFGRAVQLSTLSDPGLAGKLLAFGRLPNMKTPLKTPSSNKQPPPTTQPATITQPTVATATGQLFSLHIASLRSPENTVKLLTTLYKVPIPLLVLPVRTARGLFFAIHAGPFSSKKRALALRQRYSRLKVVRKAVLRHPPLGKGLKQSGFYAYQVMSLLNPFLALDTLKRFSGSGERPWLLVYSDRSGRQWSCLMTGSYRDKKTAASKLHAIDKMMRKGMFLRYLKSH